MGKTLLTEGMKKESEGKGAPNCPQCGQPMDNAGWGYFQCMNPECPEMGKKVKGK